MSLPQTIDPPLIAHVVDQLTLAAPFSQVPSLRPKYGWRSPAAWATA